MQNPLAHPGRITRLPGISRDAPAGAGQSPVHQRRPPAGSGSSSPGPRLPDFTPSSMAQHADCRPSGPQRCRIFRRSAGRVRHGADATDHARDVPPPATHARSASPVTGSVAPLNLEAVEAPRAITRRCRRGHRKIALEAVGTFGTFVALSVAGRGHGTILACFTGPMSVRDGSSTSNQAVTRLPAGLAGAGTGIGVISALSPSAAARCCRCLS